MTITLPNTTFQDVQNLHMFDTCSLISYTIVYNDYGEEVKTPVTTSGISCGFSYVKTFDADKGQWLSTGNNAELRLPYGTIVTDVEEVDITNRITISGTWKIFGEPEFGTTGIVLHLIVGII